MLISHVYNRLINNILKGVLGILGTAIVVRTFGPAIVGEVAYYLGIVTLLSAFSDMGASDAFGKFIVSEKNKSEFMGAFLILKALFILAFLAIVFGALFLYFSHENLNTLLFVVSMAAVLVTILSGIITTIFSSLQEYFILSKIEWWAKVVHFIYIGAVCFFSHNIYLLAGQLVVYHAVVLSAGAWICFKKNLLSFKVPAWSVYKRYWTYSHSLAISSILTIATNSADKLILGSLLGTHQLGLYQIASKLYENIDALIKPVTQTLFPKVVSHMKSAKTFIAEKFYDLVSVLSSFACMMALLMVFGASLAIPLLYGPQTHGSISVFQCFAFLLIMKLFFRPYHSVIYALEKHHFLAYLSVFDCVFSIAGYYLLVPYLGSMAIPIVMGGIWLFPSGIYVFYVFKKWYRKTYFWALMLRVFLPFIILLVLGYIVQYSFWAIPVVLGVYVGVEYYVGVLSKQRLKYLYAPMGNIIRSRSGAR